MEKNKKFELAFGGEADGLPWFAKGTYSLISRNKIRFKISEYQPSYDQKFKNHLIQKYGRQFTCTLGYNNETLFIPIEMACDNKQIYGYAPSDLPPGTKGKFQGVKVVKVKTTTTKTKTNVILRLAPSVSSPRVKVKSGYASEPNHRNYVTPVDSVNLLLRTQNRSSDEKCPAYWYYSSVGFSTGAFNRAKGWLCGLYLDWETN